MSSLSIRPVSSRADRNAFIELAYHLHGNDSNWVPPLRSEVAATIDPNKNGWFSHAEVQLFIAERGGQTVGRISAHIDMLALEMPPIAGSVPVPASLAFSTPRIRGWPRRCSTLPRHGSASAG